MTLPSSPKQQPEAESLKSLRIALFSSLWFTVILFKVQKQIVLGAEKECATIFFFFYFMQQSDMNPTEEQLLSRVFILLKANEELSGNQTVFCLILSLMRCQATSPVRAFASLDMWNQSWHFISLSASQNSFVSLLLPFAWNCTVGLTWNGRFLSI